MKKLVLKGKQRQNAIGWLVGWAIFVICRCSKPLLQRTAAAAFLTKTWSGFSPLRTTKAAQSRGARLKSMFAKSSYSLIASGDICDGRRKRLGINKSNL